GHLALVAAGAQGVQQGAVRVDLRQRADHPSHVFQGQGIEEVRVFGVTESHGHTFVVPVAHRLGVEVHAQRGHTLRVQTLQQAATIATHTEDQDVGLGPSVAVVFHRQLP
ncbi:hypothetical protein RZS08_01095, partial [Arthrospira platensis SPKY1]|nr:hypothetical protein [Arthrospira platensis SPKY1]